MACVGVPPTRFGPGRAGAACSSASRTVLFVVVAFQTRTPVGKVTLTALRHGRAAVALGTGGARFAVCVGVRRSALGVGARGAGGACARPRRAVPETTFSVSYGVRSQLGATF